MNINKYYIAAKYIFISFAAVELIAWDITKYDRMLFYCILFILLASVFNNEMRA